MGWLISGTVKPRRCRFSVGVCAKVREVSPLTNKRARAKKIFFME
jgi:hypothetical protein